MTPKGEHLLRDPVFPRLKAMVIERTGMAYWDDKDESLADTLARVLGQRGLSVGQWFDRLVAESGFGVETDMLVDAVTVGETFFFRYREQFDAIERHVLPQIIARNRDRRTLSLWSAGCSNGAEPYSLSILLARAFGVTLVEWQLDILGTDISRVALAEARSGIYSDWTVRDLPAGIRDECFVSLGGKWQVRSRYRKGVRFACHNLVTDPPPPAPPGGFDLVMCRNVLMYFDVATRQGVLSTLRRSLADGGWLVVSHAEVGEQLSGQFAPVVLPSCTLYRKPPAKGRAVKGGKGGKGGKVGTPPRPPVRPPVVPRPLLPEADPEALVRALLDLGEFSRAVELCRDWVDTAPMDPIAHYYLGLALEPLSEDQAIAAFRRALFLSPQMALAHFNLLRLFLRRGERGLARRHYVGVMADLAGLPEDFKLPMATNLTAGELSAIARRLGESP